MKGRIVSLTAGTYKVITLDKEYCLKARGVFRINNIKPVVGDIVDFNENVITKIYDRSSYLYRPEVSNINHLLIVHSLVEPEFSYSLIFKHLTYANMNGIKSSVVITKKGRFANENKLKEIENVFNMINVPVYFVDSKTGDGIEKIRPIFKNNVIALIGTSCVGKSTLLNAINPDFNRKEGSYSISLKGGKHETKEVVFLKYLDGYIVDTPGFYNLELNISKKDLAKFYPGFYLKSNECYFYDCLHINEKKCKIKEMLENNELPEIVYKSYIALCDTINK